MKNPWLVLKERRRAYNSPFRLTTTASMGIILVPPPCISHMTVAIPYGAHRLLLNSGTATAADRFRNPTLLPLPCTEVDCFLRQGKVLFGLSWEVRLLQIHQRLSNWLISSIPIGPLLALNGWRFTFRREKDLHRPRPLPFQRGDE